MDTPLCPSTARFNHIIHFVYRVQEHLLIDLNNAMNVELTASDPGDLLSSINNFNNSSDMTDGLEHVIGQFAPRCLCNHACVVMYASCIKRKRKSDTFMAGKQSFRKVTRLWQANSLSSIEQLPGA